MWCIQRLVDLNPVSKLKIQDSSSIYLIFFPFHINIKEMSAKQELIIPSLIIMTHLMYAGIDDASIRTPWQAYLQHSP